MCRLTALLLATWTCLSSRPHVVVDAATFLDDRGVTHTWDSTQKAKVGVRAGVGGVSLYHMGMREDQLVVTWGLWGIRGSDFDPTDETTYGNSIFPDADPGPEEAKFLASAANLSPSCYTNPRGCFRWDNVTDVITLYESGDLDFVLLIDNASGGHLTGAGENNGILAAEDAGVPIIFIDTFYDYNPNCRSTNFTVMDNSTCFGRSMIDITVRIEELAIFLGVDVDVDALNVQKKAACDAADAFTKSMEQLHARDIRVKVSILSTSQNETTGNSFAVIRDFDPIQLWVPRTLEELGMPLLHGELDGAEWNALPADDYFVNCATGEVNQTCNGDTYYPVDFWLIDSRSFRLIDDNFKIIFPDRVRFKKRDGCVFCVDWRPTKFPMLTLCLFAHLVSFCTQYFRP